MWVFLSRQVKVSQRPHISKGLPYNKQIKIQCNIIANLKTAIRANIPGNKILLMSYLFNVSPWRHANLSKHTSQTLSSQEWCKLTGKSVGNTYYLLELSVYRAIDSWCDVSSREDVHGNQFGVWRNVYVKDAVKFYNMESPKFIICPECNERYNDTTKRRLIDTCGHPRCYSCLFKDNPCPVCTSKLIEYAWIFPLCSV